MSTVETILTSSVLDAEKLGAIRDLQFSGPGPFNPQAIADQIPFNEKGGGVADSFSLRLLLLKAELASGTKSSSTEALYAYLLKAVPSRSTLALPKDATAVFLRARLEDMVSDYQLLTKVGNGSKLMDLVNKKLVMVNSIPELLLAQNGELVQFVVVTYRKIVEYLLLTGNEFLKLKLLRQLNDKLKIALVSTPRTSAVPTGLSHESDGVEIDSGVEFRLNQALPLVTRKLFASTILGKLVQYADFTAFLHSNLNPYIASAKGALLKNLVENHIENNILTISKYYDNITLAKVQQLLVPASVDTDLSEDIIARMISSDRLPAKTKIDQFDQVVYFPVEAGYDRMVDICELIDEVSASIEARN